MGEKAQMILKALKQLPGAAGEFALQMGTGALAAPVAGLTGLTTLGLGGSAQEAGQDIGKMQDALTYQPRTEGGKATSELFGRSMDLAHQGTNQLAEKVQDHVPGTVGSLAAAGIASSPDLLQLIGGEDAGLGGRRGKLGPSEVNWKGMTAAEARAAAMADEHLRSSRTAGKAYVGAPDWIKNKRNLNALRADLDKRIDTGAEMPIDEKGTVARDWYPEGRQAITDVTDTPADATKHAGLEALYSANRSVPQAIDLALQHHAEMAVKPPEEAIGNMPLLDRERGTGLNIEQGIQKYPSGPKVGVFGRALDPNYTGEHNRSVNDTRMAHEIFGYDNFTENNQHSFMTGEMHAAHQRAMDRGTLPPDSDVGAAQASAWATTEGRGGENSAEGLGSMLQKHAMNATYEPGAPGMPRHLNGINETNMDNRRAHAAAMSPTAPGGRDPYYTALGIPQEPTGTGIGSWPAEKPNELPFEPSILDPETGEHFEGPMHFDAYNKMPEAAQARMDDAAFGVHPISGFLDQKGEFLNRQETHDAAQTLKNEPGQDPRLGRAGQFFERGGQVRGGAAASEDFRGLQRGTVQRIQHNPLNVAHPLLPWKDADAVLNPVEYERALMTGQTGYGYHRVRELPLSDVHKANALKIDLGEHPSDAQTRTLYKQARDAGLNLIDAGGGKLTLTGPDYGGTEPTDFQAKLKGPKAATLRALGGKPGTLESAYHDIPYGNAATDWRPQGTATEGLINAQSPTTAKKLDASPALNAWLLKMNEAETNLDKNAAGALVTGPNKELHNLRSFVAEHGRQGLREMVETIAKEEDFKKPDGTMDLAKAAATMGLPAYALVKALGGSNGETEP